MARKFYFENEKELKVGDNIVLSGEESNHIKNVLRYKVGDEIITINGDGQNIISLITEIGKKTIILNVKRIEKCDSDPKINLTVFQALVKGEKLELITQKLTELGVSKLTPFYSDFCQVKPTTTRIDRLNKISIEALKQCGRAKKLEITNPITFDDVLEEIKSYEQVIFAYEKAKTTLNLEQLKNKKNIAIIVGSEGGFSEQEAKKLSQCENTQTITLGKRILRAETAIISLTSIVLFALGELS